DLHVIETGRAELGLVVSRTAENAMGVRIDQPRHQDTAAAVYFARPRKAGTEVGERLDRRDPFALDGDSNIRADRGVGHLRTAPRATGTSARDALGGVGEDERLVRITHAITSRIRDSRSGACASPRQA